jgi:hypothetical protein
MADAAATSTLLAQVTRAITDLANAQTAAANAAAAAAVPIVQPAAARVAVPAPVFALGPGLANNRFLDYNTSEGRKIYNTEVAAMPSQYDLSSDGLPSFLAKVAARA